MVSKPETPHDKLFKRTFSEVENAIPELRAILPAAVLERIDWTTLKVMPGEFVDEVLKSSHSDLLYSADLSGKPALIYVLFEHQSSDDATLPLRLLRYIVRILEWHAHPPPPKEANEAEAEPKPEPRLPLPAVIPVVLHHSESGWRGTRRLEDLFDPELVSDPELGALIPRMSFVLDDISGLSDEVLKRRALTLMAGLTLWAMRDARSPERLFTTLRVWAGAIVELLRAPNGADATEALFRYITAVTETTAEKLHEKVLEVAPEARNTLMTIAEQLEAQGRAKGRAEGRTEGRTEGEQLALLRLLQLKFGAVPETRRLQVTAASEELLARWMERILTATSLDQVFEKSQ